MKGDCDHGSCALTTGICIECDGQQEHRMKSCPLHERNQEIVYCKDCIHRPIINEENKIVPRIHICYESKTTYFSDDNLNVELFVDDVCPCILDDWDCNKMPGDFDYCSIGERAKKDKYRDGNL